MATETSIRIKIRKSRSSGKVRLAHRPDMTAKLPWWMLFFQKRSMGIRTAVLLLIVALNATGISQVGLTAAYLMDEEHSTGNFFRAGLVDFILVNEPFTPTSTAEQMVAGTSTWKDIDVIMNPFSNPMKYYASSTDFSGDMAFCEALGVSMVVGTTTLYTGGLMDLLSATTTEIAPWTMTVSLPASSTIANAMCEWNTDYNGWQTRNFIQNYGDGGFSDTETVRHKVGSGGLRINKVYDDVDESEDHEEKDCKLRSPGYWINHEGCTGNGNGSSIWSAQVNAFSTGFSSHFATSTGSQICKMENVSMCPNGNTLAGKRCRAQRHLLANELNAVSGKLDLDAIIAGTDNGDGAFDRLGLTGTSTIRQAIAAAEILVKSGTSTAQQYNDAGKVMERLYTFYENECSTGGKCIYEEEINPGRGTDPANEWVELYNQTGATVDLNGWQLCDGNICDTFSITGTTTIQPHGYAIVTGTTTTFNYWNVPNTVTKVLITDGAIGDTLDDHAELLILKRPDGMIMDQMNYGTTSYAWPNYNPQVWDPAVPDADEGHMLARVPSGYDTDQPSDWKELVPPHAELIYPTPDDTGINWSWGVTYNIEWNATNPNGPDNALLIDLFYIEDIDHSVSISTADRIRTIATSTANDGIHPFKVPSGFIGWVWVKLVATGPENPLNNTVVTSGKIYDPPAPVGELWGVEQETLPELPTYEEEYSDEVIEEVVGDVMGTSTDETASSTEPVEEETAGGLQVAPEEAATTTEETAGEMTEETGTTTEETLPSDETATTTEETITTDEATTTEETIPVEEGTTTEETLPPTEETEAPAQTDETPTTEEDPTIPPAPVETETREEEVTGETSEPAPEVVSDPEPTPEAPVVTVSEPEPALESVPEPAPAPEPTPEPPPPPPPEPAPAPVE